MTAMSFGQAFFLQWGVQAAAHLRHNLNHVESRPGDVVAHHVQLQNLKVTAGEANEQG
jgi:hypothetical protein